MEVNPKPPSKRRISRPKATRSSVKVLGVRLESKRMSKGMRSKIGISSRTWKRKQGKPCFRASNSMAFNISAIRGAEAAWNCATGRAPAITAVGRSPSSAHAAWMMVRGLMGTSATTRLPGSRSDSRESVRWDHAGRREEQQRPEAHAATREKQLQPSAGGGAGEGAAPPLQGAGH